MLIEKSSFLTSTSQLLCYVNDTSRPDGRPSAIIKKSHLSPFYAGWMLLKGCHCFNWLKVEEGYPMIFRRRTTYINHPLHLYESISQNQFNQHDRIWYLAVNGQFFLTGVITGTKYMPECIKLYTSSILIYDM